MLLIALSACDGGITTYAGTPMSDFWPKSGVTGWSMTNEDVDNVTWELMIARKPQTETTDGRELITLEFSGGEQGSDLMGAFQFSAVEGDAVLIHAYSEGSGEMIVLDPPVQVTDTDDQMREKDYVVTETGGMTFTSTFVETVSDCSNTANDKWTDCIHMHIDDGDGDDENGPIFAGHFTLVTAYWAAYMSIPSPGGQWSAANPWELVSLETGDTE